MDLRQEASSLADPARLKRNVYVLSTGFFGIFIAYNTAQVSAWKLEVGKRAGPRLCPDRPKKGFDPSFAPTGTFCTLSPYPHRLVDDVSWDPCVRACIPFCCPACASKALETTLDKDTKRANVALAVLYAMFTMLAIPAPRIVQMLGPKYVVWALQAGCDVILGKVVVGEECVWRLC